MARRVEMEKQLERERRERELGSFKKRVQTRVNQTEKERTVARISKEMHMVSVEEEREGGERTERRRE